jgi:DNA polymerase-3 subunit alpha
MEHFAGYGFNRSHSAAYALLAFQTAYLKANYPVFFMAALLTSEKTNTDKVVQYMRAALDMGIEVLPPDINESRLDFTVVEAKIRFGLAAIKNVGESAIHSILAARDKRGLFDSLFDLCEEVEPRLVNKRVFEALIKSGCFDSFGARRSQLYALIDRALEYGQRVQREKESGQVSLFGDGGATSRPPGLGKLPDLPEWNDTERLSYEKATLGFFLSGHPLNRYESELASFATCTSTKLEELVGSPEEAIGGLINQIKTLRTRKGDAMAVLRLEDQEGAVEVVVFPDAYKKFYGILSHDAPILIKGKPQSGDNLPKILASDIIPLDEIYQREASSMVLRVEIDSFLEDTLPHLRDVLEGHRGDCPFSFELYRASDFEVFVKPHPLLRVKPSPDLVADLEAMCGAGSVQLSQNADPRA